MEEGTLIRRQMNFLKRKQHWNSREWVAEIETKIGKQKMEQKSELG